ncbi:2-oxoglutarate ferredoxin oxidoreductase subunit alpha [Scopulibacillus darangshiensis]|uniref:2-oxoglutarate ferredoxin oxidoreductase subunit alpha n=1 Tax=Scopulibacillus darangshiensis TaxID=442528 RepID=A0A4R2P9T6_9BACL|nr:2-oxoacid:acceptor oxidoreductase subunit alpha [Scopulibacillus darangshiensis]TCP31702.1 2-oxoglutarate ferredoxin oxidoreductase subunit alpha [Scopulibacillus darangshiensis]
MVKRLAWKVGGQQGEGIESTGEIFAKALYRLGYHLYGYRHFSSRIKGGHTNNNIRVSTEKVRSISDEIDILIAFDQETIDVNFDDLRQDGIIIADAKFKPANPNESKAKLYAVPFTKIAADLGTSLMKNMVAVGASSAAMGIPLEYFHPIVEELFGRKGEKIVESNIRAIEQGADYFNREAGGRIEELALAPGDGRQRMYMIGNDAIALGAIAAGVRLMSAYPITPASEIMEYLIEKLPKFGGTVIQTEDEMAAATMAIGANYSGVRAFTASAGPGLSLMTESIGLSGMTETPLVIVDTQRGGPSTGLPTKQEQSDIMAMIYGTHGDIPKVVLAPSTVEEAFYDMVEAFNIADEYQCPVIVLSDLQLSLGKQSVDPFNYDKIDIRRGKLIIDDSLPELEKKGSFKRYEDTIDGVSPRTIPGTRNGLHHVTGVEHNEAGKPSEAASNRKIQMDKRLRKLNSLKFDNPVHTNTKHENPDLLLIGTGSTRGAIEEAMTKLANDGVSVNHAHIRLLHPFPAEEMSPLIEKARQVVVVEHNATGQLESLVKLNVGGRDKMSSILKYDGNPFKPLEVYNQCKGVVYHVSHV